MRTKPPSAAAISAREDILAAMQRHVAKMDALEILAVLSYTVGQCVAMQDQRTVSSEMAMEIVAANVEAGNVDAIARLLGSTGGSA